MIELNVFQRLLAVQKEGAAPREINGQFGKTRSAEQILEAYKPVCNKHGLFLTTSDSVSHVGERHYITATATVVNTDKPEEMYSANAIAWEGQIPVNKYGGDILDSSQVSGKASSYGKKYALQNLFAIDDTKDSDLEPPPQGKPAKPKQDPLAVAKNNLQKMLKSYGHDNDVKMKVIINKVLKKGTVDTVEESNEVMQALEDGLV